MRLDEDDERDQLVEEVRRDEELAALPLPRLLDEDEELDPRRSRPLYGET